jgi:hypothetical protein
MQAATSNSIKTKLDHNTESIIKREPGVIRVLFIFARDRQALIDEPRSGVRMQPTAQTVDRESDVSKPWTGGLP